MKRLLPLCLSLSIVLAMSGNAQAAASENMSKGSQNLSQGSAVVVGGSLSMLVASGQVVIASVETVGEGIVIVLKGASDAGGASIQMSAQAAKGLSLAAGTVVNVVALSTGHMLVMSGKAIAFIPNELGKALLHHSKV
ncbi:MULTISPECIES: hypothetical protein [unclassified Janthinobacterium]|uniref:hypothetical protein n=1 Tax=unclassified Janthinobacterium TaxID=2610881 RepID=UPI001610F7BC|nr:MULTISPECIES: hypothetical protein [unclassified Janthinobacterium]MBB5367222.1 hypothetical protein [Janthinobacterium sp. K2C7]MBB5380300.1 hypothetical protein [Janthinobacterium sp. K2Li3]MBB5385604.1 hypothetical protein [Janthinobacterium sp. K2E3]